MEPNFQAVALDETQQEKLFDIYETDPMEATRTLAWIIHAGCLAAMDVIAMDTFSLYIVGDAFKISKNYLTWF